MQARKAVRPCNPGHFGIKQNENSKFKKIAVLLQP